MSDELKKPRNKGIRDWQESLRANGIQVIAAIPILFGAVLVTAAVRAEHAAQVSVASLNTPISVMTSKAVLATEFETERRYIGVIEAAVAVDLGFQVAGRVVAAPVEIGDRLKRGDIIGKLDRRRLSASSDDLQARLAQAKATLALRETDLVRARQLLERNATSQVRYDEAVAQYKSAQSDVASLDAQIEGLNADLSDSILRAPFDGVVISKTFAEGDVVTASRAVIHLVQQSSIEARIGVPISFTGSLRTGDPVPILWRGETINGFIKSKIPHVDTASRTTMLVITLPKEIEAIEGETVTLVLEESVPSNGFWVPMTALVSDLKGLFAIQVAIPDDHQSHIIARAPVQVLHSDGERAFVAGALQVGDEIVVRGTHRVSPGQIVMLDAAADELPAPGQG